MQSVWVLLQLVRDIVRTRTRRKEVYKFVEGKNESLCEFMRFPSSFCILVRFALSVRVCACVCVLEGTKVGLGERYGQTDS